MTTKKIKDLSEEVVIDNGFPGTYRWIGGTSYYLGGNTNEGQVHFSINGGENEDFTKFHITHSINGSNVQVFFKEDGEFSGSQYIKRDNLPLHKEEQWNEFWAANENNFIAAAKDFWLKLNQ